VWGGAWRDWWGWSGRDAWSLGGGREGLEELEWPECLEWGMGPIRVAVTGVAGMPGVGHGAWRGWSDWSGRNAWSGEWWLEGLEQMGSQ
jgi:hypothetical protein